MSEPTIAQLHDAMARHAGEKGEVPSRIAEILAMEERWDGRTWEVFRALAANPNTMRYVAGGNRPDEVAASVAAWSESGLSIDEIKLVARCGGYTPDPFVVLARAGILRSALCNADGTVRRIDGERAGAWISDQLSLASVDVTLERAKRRIDTATTRILAEVLPWHL